MLYKKLFYDILTINITYFRSAGQINKIALGPCGRLAIVDQLYTHTHI